MESTHVKNATLFEITCHGSSVLYQKRNYQWLLTQLLVFSRIKPILKAYFFLSQRQFEEC